MATKTQTAPSKPAVAQAAPAKKTTPPSKPEGIKPEMLPIDVGGGEIKFSKRGDYAKHTAQRFAVKLSMDIRKVHIEQMIEALDKGARELQDSETPEMENIFETVMEDYIAGQEEVTRIKDEEQQKKDKEETEKREKAEKEESTYLAVKDKSADFASLAKNFDTGNMDRFVPKGDVSSEELFAALNASFGMSEFTSWMQGDLVNELEKRGELNVVARVAEAKGISTSRIYAKAKTCKMFTPEKRKSGVSFSICDEIANAKFTVEQKPKQLALAEKALTGELNTQTAREEVKKAQGKKDVDPVLPEEDAKAEFIVVDPNAEIEFIVQRTVGFPRELFDSGAKVINPRTRKVFSSFSKKPDNRWVDLSLYAKAEDGDNGKKGAKKKGK